MDPVSAWMPLSHRTRHTSARAKREIRLRIDERAGASFAPAPNARPQLRLGKVHAWSSADGRRLELLGGVTAGVVDFRSGRADLTATSGQASEAGAHTHEIHSLLTLVSGVLLTGLGAALSHAGAVVVPGGGALLLVGDSHTGKSTTCVNLAMQGWGFLSDDQTVLRDVEGRMVVEGWLRTFHLDRGWGSGAPAGLRENAAPLELAPGRWQPSAACAGLLLTGIAPDQPTRLTPVSAGEALANLIRQSPWLLADPAAAPAGLALLTRVAEAPAFRLSLGLDTFEDGARLASLIRRTVERSGDPAPDVVP